MELTVVLRKNNNQWGGDLNVINPLIEQLRRLEFRVNIETDTVRLARHRKYLLTNTTFDQREIAAGIKEAGAEYFVLPFHEDYRQYHGASLGVCTAVLAMLKGESFLGMQMTLDTLYRYPELIHYAKTDPATNGIVNAQVLTQAACVFPSADRERRTIVRDAPSAPVQVIPYAVHQPAQHHLSPGQSFRDLFNIGPDYLLQVGRLETRKNQIFTVLATSPHFQ